MAKECIAPLKSTYCVLARPIVRVKSRIITYYDKFLEVKNMSRVNLSVFPPLSHVLTWLGGPTWRGEYFTLSLITWCAPTQDVGPAPLGRRSRLPPPQARQSSRRGCREPLSLNPAPCGCAPIRQGPVQCPASESAVKR